MRLNSHATRLTPLQLEARCPPLGTVMPIIIQESVVQASIPLPEKGSCIKLRNLAATIIQGQLQSVFSEQSRWYTRPDLQNGILGVLKLRLTNRAAISGMVEPFILSGLL